MVEAAFKYLLETVDFRTSIDTRVVPVEKKPLYVGILLCLSAWAELLGQNKLFDTPLKGLEEARESLSEVVG